MRRTALLFPLLCGGILLVGVGIYWLETVLQQREIEHEAEQEIRSLQSLLQRRFLWLQEDIAYLASYPELSGGIPTEATGLRALEQSWQHYLQAARRYESIVLINRQGYALARATLAGPGNERDALPFSRLHQHVRALDSLAEGEMYFPYQSDMDVPLFTMGISLRQNKEAQGLLLLSCPANMLTQLLREQTHRHGNHSHAQWFALTAQGDLLSTSHSPTFSFQQEYPVAWAAIRRDTQGRYQSSQGVFTFLSIPLSVPTHLAVPPFFLVHFTPPEEWLQRLALLRSTLFDLMIPLMILLLPLVWWRAGTQLRREHAMTALRTREALLAQAQHLGSWEWHIAANQLHGSEEFHQILSLSARESNAVTYRTVLRRVHAQDRRLLRHAARAIRRGAAQSPLPDIRLRLDHGGFRWVHCEVAVERKLSNVVRVIGTVQDISVQKRVEESMSVAATAFNSQEAIIVTDAKATILRVNRAFTEITGYSSEESVGNNPRLLKSGLQPTLFYREMWECLQRDGFWQGEMWNRRKNGEIYPEMISIAAVKNNQGEVTHYVSHFCDITRHKEAEEKIRHLAYYDALTHLPNRTLLLERLAQGMDGNRHNRNFSVLIVVDVDHFKSINDSLGFGMGDGLLRGLTQRLIAIADQESQTARLSEDAFALFWPATGGSLKDTQEKAQFLAERIHFSLSQPYTVQDQEVHITCSLGMVIFPGEENWENEETAESLLKKAEIALFRAKDEGRNALRMFLPSMEIAARERHMLYAELRQAVARGEFTLFYQPQVDALGQLTGAEALLRWQHPKRGLLLPGVFMPAAEKTGILAAIGDWVLNEACAHIESWEHSGLLPEAWILAVNISPSQLLDEHFDERIQALLHQYHISASRLKLEITENMLIDKVDQAIRRMHVLQALGLRFSLDDFGTGYSSLAYLAQLPVQQIKIDRSFVQSMTTNPTATAIVDSTIVMAWHMGLEILAEGVETESELVALQDKGCYLYQGFYFSRPVPEAELIALLKTGKVSIPSGLLK